LEISFDHSFAGLFVLLSVAASAVICYFLYFWKSKDSSLSKIQKIVLSTFRFLTLLLLFLFLLSPVMQRNKKVKQLPILAVAIDNSQSVKSFGEAFTEFTKKIRTRFSDDYLLEFWTFGEKVKPTDSITGNERKSDYGQLIKSVKSNYINKNIGALVILGDGIYNQGQNPENIASGLKFPVYTIGVGDTTHKTDALIKNVRTNKTAFLKNKFPVEIELNFSKLKNKIAYLEIENDGKSVFSNTISITSEDFFKLEFVNIEAAKPGLQHYKIRLKALDGEVNLSNNEAEFVIQVIENKQKILMLSDGPHPDLGAIRNSINKLQNYEVKLSASIESDSLSSYSLIILNQLPSEKNVSSKLLEKIKATRIPVLFLVGPNTLIEQLNNLDMGLKIATSKNTEEVQAFFDPNFSLFTLSDETKQVLKTASPLIAPFGNTELSPTLQNTAFQSIKNIQTSKTMLAFGTQNGRKTGYIIGDGLWRWRLYDYQENGNHNAFNEFIQKIVQYLSLHENEDNFNVYHPAIYQETDKIELTAELYNDSYELVNTPDVNIRILDDSLRELKFQFDRSNDFYKLDAGNLHSGDYTFEAETTLGNQHFTEKGNFSIQKSDIETQDMQANFGTLYQLSKQTGGKFCFFEKNGTLLDSLSNNQQLKIKRYKQTIQSEWINLKLLFFLIIILLGAEWFFRKYWGIY